jgi:hypothetical protein
MKVVLVNSKCLKCVQPYKSGRTLSLWWNCLPQCVDLIVGLGRWRHLIFDGVAHSQEHFIGVVPSGQIDAGLQGDHGSRCQPVGGRPGAEEIRYTVGLWGPSVGPDRTWRGGRCGVWWILMPGQMLRWRRYIGEIKIREMKEIRTTCKK